jgi:hypothetical protein
MPQAACAALGINRSRTVTPPLFPAWRSPHARKRPRSGRRQPRPAPRRPWVKTKCLNRAEFVVIGWSDPEGSRPYVGALLLGYYESDGRLVCAGRVGAGMSQKTQRVRRAILWMSHQPMRSSAEFIAAFPSPARGPSPAFGSLPLASAISGLGAHARGRLERPHPPGEGRRRLFRVGIFLARPGRLRLMPAEQVQRLVVFKFKAQLSGL